MDILRVFAVAIAVVGLLGSTSGQANYDKQAISKFYDQEGLPVFSTLNGTVTELDQISSSISLNKTKADLNCSSGFMSVKMQFQAPFFGIVYADYDRNSACKIVGRGQVSETIKLPLKGCGTKQQPARVFTNNIVVRFHPGLEIDGDEVITIICRYPQPIVPPPVIPAGLQVPQAEVVRTLQPLREFEILLIICAIIFLALMLLGIGCSYYCLKKRNIRVIRKRPASTLGSEITKISEPVSMFNGLKIPRAHAEDTSGSEELTESVHSEFPSELMSTASEEDYTSAYSDAPFELAEGRVYPELHAPPAPGFDIKMAVKNKGGRPYSPASSKASSESELILKAQEQYLTTILERTETNTLETLERIRRVEAGAAGPPPVHARVRVVNNKAVSDNSELESESEYSQITDIQDFYHDRLELATAEQPNFTVDMKESLIEGSGRKKKSKRAQSIATSTSSAYDNRVMLEEVESMHVLQTVDEKQDYHSAGQFGTQDRLKLVTAGQPKFTGDMKESLVEGSGGKKKFKRAQSIATSTSSAYDNRVMLEEVESTHVLQTVDEKQDYNTSGQFVTQDLITPVILERATAHMSVGGAPPKNNFDVLIRILDNGSVSGAEDDDVSSVLTEEERYRLKEVIMKDESLQTLLKESYTTEKILQLKDHRKIEQVIKPQKWDVLIRILDNAEVLSGAGTGDSKSSPHRSSLTGHEARSMSEVMVDFTAGYGGGVIATQSGASSTYTQARSAADRSATELVATDQTFTINKEAYFSSESYHHHES